MLNIPSDIAELIFDELDSTVPNSLKSYTLVCKSWLAPAQKRLFRRKHFLRLESPDTYNQFLAILYASPQIAEYIREVYIGPRTENALGPDLEWIWGVSQILNKLKQVESIRIDLTGTFVNDDIIKAFSTCLESIGSTATKLELMAPQFQGKPQVHMLLALFPKVTEMRCSSCAEERQLGDEVFFHAYSRLRKLEFTECGLSYSRTILQSNTVPFLRHLVLECNWGWPDDIMECTGILPSLCSLHLYQSTRDSPNYSAISLLGMKFPNLEHFTLEERSNVGVPFRAFAPFVANVPHSVHTITMIPFWAILSQLDDRIFEEMDSAIARSSCRVEIVLITASQVGPRMIQRMFEAEDAIVDRFKALKAYQQGVVHLSFR